MNDPTHEAWDCGKRLALSTIEQVSPHAGMHSRAPSVFWLALLTGLAGAAAQQCGFEGMRRILADINTSVDEGEALIAARDTTTH